MSESEAVLLAKAVSRVIGWLYFLCWYKVVYTLAHQYNTDSVPLSPRSASFYPQPISNWRRKHTLGLAIDFPTLNVLGFCCYAVSTAAFLYSPTIRSQYAYRHHSNAPPTVRFNDLLFAAHGAVMCIIIYSQFFPRIWNFKVGSRQQASRPVLGVFWGSVAAIFAVALLAQLAGKDGGYDPSGWAWIDVVCIDSVVFILGGPLTTCQIYVMGYVKLLTVVLKYIPQAYHNYKRKSTEGWSIYTILLDFAGGWLSLGQLVIDSALQNDWSGISGNPIKFGLGNVTIVFDIIFFLQHYVLYRHPAKTVEEEEEWDRERERLIRGDD